MRLLLLGCTGLVGRELVPALLSAGHQLTLVSRRSRSGVAWTRDLTLDWVQQDPSTASSWTAGGALQQALAAAEGVINLAGEPIAEQRWTATHVQLLNASRVATTTHLVAAMQALETPPAVGSAVHPGDRCADRISLGQRTDVVVAATRASDRSG